MITKKQLRVYEQLRGNSDALARVKRRIPQLMTDKEWRAMDTILSDLFLVQSGLASADFETRALAEATEIAEDELVCQRLVEIAKLRSRSSEKWLVDHSVLK